MQNAYAVIWRNGPTLMRFKDVHYGLLQGWPRGYCESLLSEFGGPVFRAAMGNGIHCGVMKALLKILLMNLRVGVR